MIGRTEAGSHVTRSGLDVPRHSRLTLAAESAAGATLIDVLQMARKSTTARQYNCLG